MKQRPLSVAFGNGRIVVMKHHMDCVELAARYDREGVTQRATALLYREGETFIVLGSVSDEDGSRAEAWDAEAYLREQDASAAAVRFALYATRTGERG